MSYCPSCGTQGEPDSRFCQKCGTALPGGPVAAAAGSRAGSKAPTMLVVGSLVAVAIVIAGFVAWTMFFKPLSADDYELQAEEATFRIVDASGELDNMVARFDEYDFDESFDRADVDVVRADFEAMASEMRAGHRDLEAMRPPKIYESEHGALLAVTGYFTTDFLDQIESAFESAEDGATPRDLYEDYEEGMEDLERDLSDINRELGRLEDLPFAEELTDYLYSW